ncbi:MAG: universal stress protein [Blastocatellia bacterium]|nr:universal stress protein [Blastocatellia bacterium]MCS7158008.1 universal stress protein [Blastocatellia bacterium]MCX7752515.1 universal stress protein [Blastocatellia bacterium]MDW8167370.1 universal stress protein [Acidobacteriota bacterium]MDW8257305.1 universal stress protein [Acidobacteriota bacterium]
MTTDSTAIFPPRRILCPTDFSELATFALRYAAELARCSKASLLVMHADPFLPPPYLTAGQFEEMLQALERTKAATRRYLTEYVRNVVGTEPDVEPLLVEDTPARAILETARQREADLIVMGTHGRSGLSRVMLGSVTERVLRESDRPVLTIRYKAEALPTPHVSVRHLLCPVNYTPIARTALQHAVAIARCFNAELTVVHVLEDEAQKASDREALARLCEWVPEDVRAHCQMKELIRRGNAAEQIIETARALGSDMIVLGAHHKRFFDATVIGTTTVRVTRHAPCPVLVVPGRE